MTKALHDLVDQILQQMLWTGAASEAGKKPTKQKKKGKHKAGTNAPNGGTMEKAFRAIKLGNASTLAKLVTTPVQANWHRDGQGWSLLDEAVQAKSLAMVDWLLSKGANPNTLFRNDEPHVFGDPLQPGLYFSPLATSLRIGSSNIAALLIHRGASWDLPVWFSETEGFMTCKGKADESGLLPSIEAALISRAIPSGVTSPGTTKRL